jgi:hypothetical protein
MSLLNARMILYLTSVINIVQNYVINYFNTVISIYVESGGNDRLQCITPIVAMQRLGKHVRVITNTHNNSRIAGRVIFNAFHIL